LHHEILDFLQIDVRQFPVTVHFNKKTPVCGDSDKNKCPYLKEAYKKVSLGRTTFINLPVFHFLTIVFYGSLQSILLSFAET